ncbi:MAG TPA: hypothetical protein VK638_22410 [Edaphobacter sp.]|nr:hypothetical protein [Edaphobacter sp.]
MADSKGKKVWGIVRIINDFRWALIWLYSLPLVAKLVAPLIALGLVWLSIFLSLPWPVIVFCTLVAGYLVGLFVWALGKPPIPEQIVTPKVLDLSFTVHSENNPLLCLEVRNNGDDVKITASVRVVSRSYGGSVNTRPYVGQWTLLSHKKRWDDYRPDPTASAVAIPSGTHRILEIARQDPENGRGNDISEAKVVGFDEFLRWDHEQKPDSKLPSFRLQIEFLAEGVSKSLCKLYDVGPVHAYGPLGMTEVTA